MSCQDSIYRSFLVLSIYVPINVIPDGGGGGIMPDGVAFDFMDSPQGADI